MLVSSAAYVLMMLLTSAKQTAFNDEYGNGYDATSRIHSQ